MNEPLIYIFTLKENESPEIRRETFEDIKKYSQMKETGDSDYAMDSGTWEWRTDEFRCKFKDLK